MPVFFNSKIPRGFRRFALLALALFFSVSAGAVTFEEALKKAEQGEASAQLSLSDMYRRGQGVAQNYEEAAKWVRKAAEQGHAIAQYSLGTMYAFGHGVTQNEVEAAKWVRMAAEQGEETAQFHLGDMYINGRGVAQNNVTAYMWFILGLSQTSPASPKYHRVVEFLDDLARKMTPPQIAEAQHLAREWQKQHR
jgi:TPR repeat protein